MLSAPLALTVFLLGLRHGADPDHLAAIDNITRNVSERRPHDGRFVGALFALGHGLMVLCMALLADRLGTLLGTARPLVEHLGAWLSILVLLLMAGFNLPRLLNQADPTSLTGPRTRFFGKALKEVTHPLLAVPVGLLFGIGFETSTQIAAFGTALGSTGPREALLIGGMFCAGMICTDTFDSLLVSRFIADPSGRERHIRAAWLWLVSIFAVVVALCEMLQELGWQASFDELALSGLMLLCLLGIYCWARVRSYEHT